MCNEAAVLVDRIFPNAPLRQWVMSLPFELRALAATRPDVLGAMERIFAEETERLTLLLAGVADAATGCIGFPQRFGSSSSRGHEGGILASQYSPLATPAYEAA